MALINTTTTGVLGSTFFGDGTGPLTVQQNGVTLGIYGNIPAFSAYASAAQTVTTGTDTKVTFGAISFDTNNNFASSRFTPTISGYYQLSTTIRFNGTSPSQYVIYWYKNGASERIGNYYNANLGVAIFTQSTLLYLNGTTDYVEVYVNQTATSPTVGSANVNTNWFSGFLAKAA
jgi:hypothetical protein